LIHATDDPDEAARAPAGDSIVGDVCIALERLAVLVPKSNRPNPKTRPAAEIPAGTDPIPVAFAMSALAAVLRAEAAVVEESASSRAAFYDHIRIENSTSYFATASGGLGFALPAAVGVGLARPKSPVACIVGDGAAMFGIQAIWTAAQYEVPVVYVVLDNGQYGILKAFAAFQRTPGVPGLDLPGLDVAMVAKGFGAETRRITAATDLADAYQEAFATAEARRCPVLLDIVVDSEVGPLFGEPAS
jgi:benzoylformate decarboxylase